MDETNNEPTFIVYIEAQSFEFPASDIWLGPDEIPDNPTAKDVIEAFKKNFDSPLEVILDENLLDGATIHVDGGLSRGSASWSGER